MSARQKHESGDCWWPCHYCQAEEDHAPVFLEPHFDDAEKGDE